MPKGKINVYICGTLDAVGEGEQKKIQLKEGKHRTITIDRDEGTTPFMIECKHKGCMKSAYSAFYPSQAQHLVPTHEWYMPGRRELRRLRKSFPATYDHCTRGGLLLRKIIEYERRIRKPGIPVRH